eukprot:679203-Rhodomonas_salina.1
MHCLHFHLQAGPLHDLQPHTRVAHSGAFQHRHRQVHGAEGAEVQAGHDDSVLRRCVAAEGAVGQLADPQELQLRSARQRVRHRPCAQTCTQPGRAGSERHDEVRNRQKHRHQHHLGVGARLLAEQPLCWVAEVRVERLGRVEEDRGVARDFAISARDARDERRVIDGQMLRGDRLPDQRVEHFCGLGVVHLEPPCDSERGS